MPDERRCRDCGATLAADAPRGLCVKCLLKAGISDPATMVVPVPTPATGQKQGDWIGPYKLLQQIGEGGLRLSEGFFVWEVFTTFTYFGRCASLTGITSGLPNCLVSD